MIRTHPLFQPVMGLMPFTALAWETGQDHGTLWENGLPLEHASALLEPTPIKCDAITDNTSLFAVGYGVGKLFEDDCFEPCSLETLKTEATGIHLHQLCTFIATNIDPLPFAKPMLVTDQIGLNQYIATTVRRPTLVHDIDGAINKLLTHFAT